MSENDVAGNEDSKNIFNVLSFERKLIELVEELRLRRELESESERTFKSVMDEKYKEELNWEELQRRYIKEKDDLEQQIEILKRKLEDKVCVSDDNKAKQQVINKTYSYEIRALKEELRTSKSEKLNLQKRIQELEAKLNLHHKFQENIASQLSEIRKQFKLVIEDSQELANVQKNVLINVADAKRTFRKYDLCNDHLQKSLIIVEKETKALKKALIASRSELTTLRNSVALNKEKPNNDLKVKELEEKILELDNLLLLSRTENQKTMTNFVESNQLLCKFMDKYSKTQEQEKCSAKALEECQDKLKETERCLHEALEKIQKMEDMTALKEKQRIQNHNTKQVQTEEILLKNFLHSSEMEHTSGADSISVIESLPSEFKETSRDLVDELRNYFSKLQQNATIKKSEICVENISLRATSNIQTHLGGFSKDKISGNLSEKKITFSEILKRKIEVLDTGDEIQLISMKRRLRENDNYPVVLEMTENGVDNDKKLLSLDALHELTAEHVIDGNIKQRHFPEISADHKYLSSPMIAKEINEKCQEKEHF